MSRRRLFAATFVWAISVVLAVHLLHFSGSVPDFEKVSGGGKLLDVAPAFSADALYSRLEQYGEAGRRNYVFRNLSVDVILPLSVLPFLLLLMRRAISPFALSAAARTLLLSMPFVYVVFDLAENASVVALLTNYPDRLTTLAAVLPSLTVIKRAASMLAIFLPLAMLMLGHLRSKRATALASE